MPKFEIPNAGAVGVVKDLSQHELPPQAWTDARNIRFLDGFAYQFLGHSQVYGTPTNTPQYVMPVTISGNRAWIYATAANTYVVTNSSNVALHTDITHATARTGTQNGWTGCVFGGIPILNANDGAHNPMYWDQNLAHKFVDLTNWPANTTCKSLRAYKNFLIALNVTSSGTNYPYMVKWSHPADPGTLPSSWDQTDATKDAGQYDISDGQDVVVDGLQLGDSFIVYKEASAHRMDYTGGTYVFRFRKINGIDGIMNRNCMVDIGAMHFVLTGSDVLIHDGNTAQSVMDKKTRRYLFQSIDITNKSMCFVFKNPFLNEAYVAYPSIGSSVCDKAMVYNYKDGTVSFRDLPNLNHAACGLTDPNLLSLWSTDNDTWDSDLSAWNGPEFTPDTARVLMASNDTKLFMLDGSSTFDGTIPTAYLERRGLSLGDPEQMKTITSIRPRIYGPTGYTVLVYVGSSPDPYSDPTYGSAITFTIGTTVSCDVLLTGRYLAVKFASGTAYQWRLDSYDIPFDFAGAW